MLAGSRRRVSRLALRQPCTACSRCIMRGALPRDFARINLLQWFSRAGFGDETVFLRARNRVETEPRCGEIETRERGRAACFRRLENESRRRSATKAWIEGNC